MNENLGLDELAYDEQFKCAIIEVLNKVHQTWKFKGYERIKRIYIEKTPFAELGLLTETMKFVRHKGTTHYKDVFGVLYQGLD